MGSHYYEVAHTTDNNEGVRSLSRVTYDKSKKKNS